MRILVVHNAYARRSGEEAVVDFYLHTLRQAGYTVEAYRRSSAEISGRFFGEIRAFFSGIYSLSARREMRRLLREYRPDVVNIHNLYPLISPSILPECRRAGVPVVMTVHNYRLFCPNGLLFSGGEICLECLDAGNEWPCIRRNCEGNFGKSLGYALRNTVARRLRFYFDGVTRYLVLSAFQRDLLVRAGFPAARISVLPNAISSVLEPGTGEGAYVGYAGRISAEKGMDLLIAVARKLPEIPFRLAGAVRPGVLPEELPENVILEGMLDAPALADFYRNARCLVLPSRCFEGFPMMVVEAMTCARAVIAPNHGGIPEMIRDGESGLLFTPGSVDSLASCVRTLWEAPENCRKLGQAASLAAACYAPERVCAKLCALLEETIREGR